MKSLKMHVVRKVSMIPAEYLLLFFTLPPFAAPKFVAVGDQCSWNSSSSIISYGYCVGEAPPSGESRPQVSNWSPWTHRPSCAGQYCIFTKRTHDISIITTPENMARKLDGFEAVFTARSAELPSSQRFKTRLWEVRDIEGKGKGVIALKKIGRGELVMLDYASLLVDSELAGTLGQASEPGMVSQAVNQLPDRDEILSLSRSSIETSAAAEDILRTNSYDIRSGGVEYAALFPRLSVIINTPWQTPLPASKPPRAQVSRLTFR